MTNVKMEGKIEFSALLDIFTWTIWSLRESFIFVYFLYTWASSITFVE